LTPLVLFNGLSSLIKQTGKIPFQPTPTQLKERYFEVLGNAQQLMSDFAFIEERFEQIAQSLLATQMQPDMRRGALVGQVLDANDALMHSEQGESFHSFCQSLLSPHFIPELYALIESVSQLPVLQGIATEGRALKYLPRYLLDASQNIIRSVNRMAERLRRLLEDNFLAEQRRLGELLARFRKEALYFAVHDLPFEDDFLLIEELPRVKLSLARELWEPSEPAVFFGHPSQGNSQQFDPVDLASFCNQFFIDIALLQERIETLLEQYIEITLAQVVKRQLNMTIGDN
jgi:hypothetical protein